MRSLYRSILRLATRFDTYSLSKLLLYRNHLTTPSKVANRRASRYYHNILIRRLYRNEDEAKFISPRHHNNVSLVEIVKEEFRRENVMISEDDDTPDHDHPSSSFSSFSDPQQGMGGVGAAVAGGSQGGKESMVEITDRIDAAFTVLRKLSVIWKSFDSMYSEQQETLNALSSNKLSHTNDNNNNNNNNIDNSSHTDTSEAVADSGGRQRDLTVTESFALLPGILLAAHPMVKGPLHRSVILLLEHNTQGTYGIVLNRPTYHKLGDAVKNLPTEILDNFGGREGETHRHLLSHYSLTSTIIAVIIIRTPPSLCTLSNIQYTHLSPLPYPLPHNNAHSYNPHPSLYYQSRLRRNGS